LAGDPDLPGQRARERIEALGFDGARRSLMNSLRDIAAGTLRADLAAFVVLADGRFGPTGSNTGSNFFRHCLCRA
jgi:hypothetical protein